jgi:hypothetical protein
MKVNKVSGDVKQSFFKSAGGLADSLDILFKFLKRELRNEGLNQKQRFR